MGMEAGTIEPLGATTGTLTLRHAAAARRRVRGAYARSVIGPAVMAVGASSRKAPVRLALRLLDTTRQCLPTRSCAFTARAVFGLSFPASVTFLPMSTTFATGASLQLDALRCAR